MAQVQYIADESWQGFEKGMVYDVEPESLNAEVWFVYKEPSPFTNPSTGRRGYCVHDHKCNFQILDPIGESTNG